MNHSPRPQTGFTLIELMIVVAIVAILSAVAMPSYLDYLRRGKRVDARSLIQAASLDQERYRLSNTSYASATTALVSACPGSGTCYSDHNNYSLGVTVSTSSSYSLTATAVSSSQLADTGCTALTLTVSGTNMTYSPSTCWAK